jgi:adenosylcobinamide-phosphate synthase
LPAALLLDRVLGDPNVSWHPVRLIGRLALGLESVIYPRAAGKGAGALAFGLLVAITVGTTALLLALAQRVHPVAEGALAVLVVYVSIAPRDLASHARRVLSALEQRDLPLARARVSYLVGRDTTELEEAEVSRAAVESVAESLVDGVTAPLFWAALFGPLGAIGYRAVNTLDSLWGHHDERYERFGMVSARADDVANFLPARLTLLFIAVAAGLMRLNARAAFVLGMTQGPRHSSPNSGLSEAAFAGALDVTLGGRNRYDGQWHEGPKFGTMTAGATPATLRTSIALMWVTTAVALISFLVVVAAVKTLFFSK